METSKYNVSKNIEKRTCNGIVFDSIIEMRFYKEVVLPSVEKGTITSFELQKKFELQPKFEYKGKKYAAIYYIADFVLTYPDGHVDVIDIKGYPDHVAPIKRKLFCYKYPDMNFYWLYWIKKYGGWIEYDESKKLKREEKKRKKQEEKENGKDKN